jgi:excisionase family DNA binding protein
MNPWNVKKTSEYLDRSKGTIRNLVLRRKIPFRKAGGRLTFLEHEINEWIEKSPGLSINEYLEKLK